MALNTGSMLTWNMQKEEEYFIKHSAWKGLRCDMSKIPNILSWFSSIYVRHWPPIHHYPSKFRSRIVRLLTKLSNVLFFSTDAHSGLLFNPFFPLHSQPCFYHLWISVHQKKKKILEYKSGELLPSIASTCKLRKQMIF